MNWYAKGTVFSMIDNKFDQPTGGQCGGSITLPQRKLYTTIENYIPYTGFKYIFKTLQDGSLAKLLLRRQLFETK